MIANTRAHQSSHTASAATRQPFRVRMQRFGETASGAKNANRSGTISCAWRLSAGDSPVQSSGKNGGDTHAYSRCRLLPSPSRNLPAIGAVLQRSRSRAPAVRDGRRVQEQGGRDGRRLTDHDGPFDRARLRAGARLGRRADRMGRHVDGMPLPNKRSADERDGAERPTGKHKPVQCGVAATVLIFDRVTLFSRVRP